MVVLLAQTTPIPSIPPRILHLEVQIILLGLCEQNLTFTALTDARLLVLSKARLDALPATAMLAVARVVMARSSHEYRHHTAVVANLMQ